MAHLSFAQHREHLSHIGSAALASADAGRAVENNLGLQGDELLVGTRTLPLDPSASLYLVALGKAAPSMTRVAAGIVGDRLRAGIATLPLHGSVTGLDPNAGRPPARIRFLTGEHPLPGPGSLGAGLAVSELMSQTHPQDVVLVLVSGGGSALLELLLPGITLRDLRRLNQLLLDSGMPIQEINHVRKAISRLKGGGLARLAAPARTVSLILSDVVGDPLGSIASGPTVLRRKPQGYVRSLLRERNLWSQVPSSVRKALEANGPPRRRARRPYNLLIGSNRQVVLAAAESAAGLGFKPKVLTYAMQGEARAVGTRFARRLLRADPGSCLLMGGETTVQVLGGGRGGRNQELALAAALRLEGRSGAALMTLGTDGVDGPTDAAGAMVSDATVAEIRAAGLDPEQALLRNDSYPALDAAAALVRTGPTGTNLNDLVVGLRYGRN